MPSAAPALGAHWPRFDGKVFSLLFAAHCAIYFSWLIALWPGVLGEDSLAILRESESTSFLSTKTSFWYYFVKLFYSGHSLVEVPIGAQLVFAAVVFSRILAWCWQRRLRKTFFFCLLFISLAPHKVFYMGTLYSDGVFAVGSVGLLFELWLATAARRFSRAGLVMVAATLPFALFARPNGLVFLLPIAGALLLLDKNGRRWLLLITVGWCALNFIGSRLHRTGGHAVLFPVALFETVGFLQPRPMNLWTPEPRVSETTTRVLSNFRPLDFIIRSYDSDYWDTLTFKPDGPLLGGLAPAAQKIVVDEFFRYSLWHNLPRFIASRVNIFPVSALAQGGIPSLTFPKFLLTLTQSRSVYREFDFQHAEAAWTAVHQASLDLRWLLWSPLPGIVLLGVALRRALLDRDRPLLLASSVMWLQLGAIFFLSIAGEYRYLLPFFFLPLALLPMLASSRSAALGPPEAAAP